MKPRGHQGRARRDRRRATLSELADRACNGSRGRGAHLYLRQEGLVVDPVRWEAGLRQNLVGNVRELECRGVDEKQLFLQADRESGSLPEPVGHGASPSAARAAILPNTSAA